VESGGRWFVCVGGGGVPEGYCVRLKERAIG
jgi:hypothetical protein